MRKTRLIGIGRVGKCAAIVLALVLALSAFAACGSGSGDGTGGSGDAPKGGGPNANPDGTVNLDNVAYYDPDFDYSQSKTYKVKYLTNDNGPLYEDFSKAFEAYAPLFNMQYDGHWSANGDADLFMTQLQSCADQGYDAVFIDPDDKTYPALSAIFDANPQMKWISCIAPARNLDEEGMPLIHPSVGFEHYLVGCMEMEKSLEYAAKAWPDVPMDEIGVVAIDFAVALPLHLRAEGAQDIWDDQYPNLKDNFSIVDGSSDGQTSDTARNLLMPVLSINEKGFTHWLIIAAHDDYAIGAAAAIDSLGLTDTANVVTMGGAGLITQWDSGRQDAWRYAYLTPQNIYAEPVMGAMYAFLEGYADYETIWPRWVNINDHGGEGHTYASMLIPSYWIDIDNYKHFLAWQDIYSGIDAYGYDKTGVTRDDYSAIAEVPAYYTQQD